MGGNLTSRGFSCRCFSQLQNELVVPGATWAGSSNRDDPAGVLTSDAWHATVPTSATSRRIELGSGASLSWTYPQTEASPLYFVIGGGKDGYLYMLGRDNLGASGDSLAEGNPGSTLAKE